MYLQKSINLPVAAREGGLWGGALPEIYKRNKENIFF
jgi:hypothetical protein